VKKVKKNLEHILVKRVTVKEPPEGASKKKKEKSVTMVEEGLKTPMESHGRIHLGIFIIIFSYLF
jgi:hypothetical protein